MQINAVFLKCYIPRQIASNNHFRPDEKKYRNYHIIVNGYTGYTGNYPGLMETVKVPVGLYC